MRTRRIVIGLCLLATLLLGVILCWPIDQIDYYFPLNRELAPNYHKLVSAKWVSELLEGKQPPTYSGGQFIILHVSPSTEQEYSQGHIPGAVLLLTNQIERAPLWNLISDKELQKVIESYGITQRTLVVIYSQDPSAAHACYGH